MMDGLEFTRMDDDDDLANERDFLASLIERLKCEIDDSKNCNKFLETSNKALVDKLKEANNELSKTSQLMFKDLKKFQAELDRHHDVKYASKIIMVNVPPNDPNVNAPAIVPAPVNPDHAPAQPEEEEDPEENTKDDDDDMEMDDEAEVIDPYMDDGSNNPPPPNSKDEETPPTSPVIPDVDGCDKIKMDRTVRNVMSDLSGLKKLVKDLSDRFDEYERSKVFDAKRVLKKELVNERNGKEFYREFGEYMCRMLQNHQKSEGSFPLRLGLQVREPPAEPSA
uniref:Uncharacterized protein n=1 Tax=Tanacetum cinerariifolium TaxID=118510 RepID=A0A6L2K6Q2_TANCI|nr:hypothetical protein [Tanacetum cinerariifolium]